MERTLEFEFEGGGRLCFELLQDGGLLVRLQATHPGEGLKVTSTSVIVDPGKVEAIKAWLAKGGVE
jgi:hypothetical protein